MKNIKLIIIILLGYIPIYAQHNNYLIGFYNVENMMDYIDDPRTSDDDFTPNGLYNYTEEHYNQKVYNIVRVIQSIEKDEKSPFTLLGLAEVENTKVLFDICNNLDKQYAFIHFDGKDVRGIDVALLYNKNIFKPIKANSYPIQFKNQQERFSTRDILIVQGILDEKLVNIIVTHWPSRFGGEYYSNWKRKIVAENCKHIIDSIKIVDTYANIILMGDFNDEPNSNNLTEILQVVNHKKNMNSGKLYNPFYQLYKNGMGTLGYNDEWFLFDQIILNNLKIETVRVYNKGFLIEIKGKNKNYPKRSFEYNKWNNGYSDHFPIYIKIKK